MKLKVQLIQYLAPKAFLLILPLALLMLSSCTAQKTVELPDIIQRSPIQEYSPTNFLVMYDTIVGKEPLLKAIKTYQAEIIYDYNIIPGMALKKPEDKTLEETIQFFRKVKGVVTVEYDFIHHLDDPVKPRLEIE